jgi:hypothetical protein
MLVQDLSMFVSASGSGEGIAIPLGMNEPAVPAGSGDSHGYLFTNRRRIVAQVRHYTRYSTPQE